MATSFKTLRRYEKVGLIILGVIVMIFFTIDPSVLTGNRRGGPDSQLSGATYVSWNGGSLTYRQIEQIIRDHSAVMEVQREIFNKLQADRNNPGSPKVQPIRQAWMNEDVVNRYILASYANSIGIHIDDNAVRDYLRKLGDDRLNLADIKQIVDDTVGDSPEARTRFFSALRRELAAQAVERMVLSLEVGITPGSIWEQFQQIRQRAQIEFLELPVKNYLDQVKDAPSDAQLRTLYEELKTQYRRADVPDSGVKRPEELAFQWVRADFETFVKEEMKNVTDEQVAEYYERNKVNYKLPSKPPVRPNTEEPGEEGNSEKPASDDPGAEKPESEHPKPENEPSEKPADSPENSGAAEPNTEKPAEPDEPTPGADEPKSEDPPSSGEEDSELVSFVAGSVAQDSPQQDPAQSQPAQDTPAGEPAQEPATEDAEPQEEYRPLSEVADQIRRDLASRPADERYNAAIKKAEEELREFWKKVNLGDGKIDEKAVQEFDLEAFAAKYNLTWGVLPLSPADVAMTYPDLGQYPGFVQQAYFGDRSMRYEPRMISSPISTTLETYIYWRTDEKAEYVPTFEESRDDLIAADRYRKAKELARKDAQEKAAQVKVSSSLKETFPKENVLVTGQFSQAEGRILEIPNADSRFVSEVFKMKPLTAAAINLADESSFFVVYLSHLEYSNEELKTQFERFPAYQELARSADFATYETRREAFDEFMAALNRQFHTQPTEE